MHVALIFALSSQICRHFSAILHFQNVKNVHCIHKHPYLKEANAKTFLHTATNVIFILIYEYFFITIPADTTLFQQAIQVKFIYVSHLSSKAIQGTLHDKKT